MMTTLHDWFIAPFAYGFMQRGLLSALLLGLGGGMLGAALPPLASVTGPPPDVPQPDPRMGAVPGARQGMVRDQSLVPLLTSTLKVR